VIFYASHCVLRSLHPQSKFRVNWKNFGMLLITVLSYSEAGFSKLRPAKLFCLWWKNNTLTKNLLIWWMQPFPKQWHYARRPALELSCNSICDPRTKKFGDPCSKVWSVIEFTKLFPNTFAMICLSNVSNHSGPRRFFQQKTWTLTLRWNL